MDLFSGLFIGKESLLAHGAAMATAADNIANSNTVGFKEQRTDFANLVADSIGGLYSSPLNVGSGVKADQITTVHNQGTLEETDRSLDFAINGVGYFVATDGVNQYYTRAGNFFADADGNLVTTDGYSVLGYTAASPTTPTTLNLSNAVANASPTTTVTISGNLDARAQTIVPPTNPATFRAIETDSSFSNAVRVIDSLGTAHDVSLFFFKTGTLAYTVQAFVDGGEVGGVAGTPVQVGTSQIAFQSTGQQAAGAASALNLAINWGNGAAASAVAVDTSGITGFSSLSSFNSLTSDGVQIGTLVGTVVDDNGVISAQLSSGQTVEIGTLALARFRNPNGLRKVGDNDFVEGDTSGTALVGTANSDGRGEIKAESLENSTVDLASQFINIMRYQRGYQAGSQVLQTISQMLNTTMQIA